MDKPKKLRPEELDTQMDSLDIMGLDDVELRLPLIQGIEYTKPPTWDEVWRDLDGGAPVPTER